MSNIVIIASYFQINGTITVMNAKRNKSKNRILPCEWPPKSKVVNLMFPIESSSDAEMKNNNDDNKLLLLKNAQTIHKQKLITLLVQLYKLC